MKVVIFGATGMIGGGVLVECLEDPDVTSVVTVGRRGVDRSHPKLREVVASDLFDLAGHRDEIGAFDACFYCLGVSAAGMTESEYRRLTYDLTTSVVDVLESINPRFTLCFVSGQGADSSAQGRVMWARVKGAAENELLARPFPTYVFRPGAIQPLKGARSQTRSYRVLYAILGPLLPVLRKLFPGSVTSTVEVGRAMLNVASHGFPRRILETGDINTAAHPQSAERDPPAGSRGA